MARAPRHLSSPPSPLPPSSRAGYHPTLAKPLDLLPPSLSRRTPLSLSLPNASRGTLSLPLSLPPHHPRSYLLSPSLVTRSFNSTVLLPRVIRLRFFLLRTKESSLCPAVLHCFLRFHLPAVFAFFQSFYHRFLIVLREHEIDFLL